MEYTTEFNDTKEICTVRVTGRHKRPDDSMLLQQLALDIGDEHGCQRFLFDMTQAEIIAGIMETFEVGTVPIDHDQKMLRNRVALVYKGDLSQHKFMETVAFNRGYRMRVFAEDEMDQALEWLRLNNI